MESDHIGHTKLHTLRLSGWHKDIEMLHWCHFFLERLAGQKIPCEAATSTTI